MCIALFATSCFKDHSATDFKIVNPITIDMGGKSLSVQLFRYDTLRVEPLVYKNGVADNDMSYSWRIQGNEYPITEIANTMSLKYPVGLPQNSTPYKFILKVTDNTTKIEKEETVSVTVASDFGEALLVADTRDELTTDISLISSMNFTKGITDEYSRTLRDVYSLSNNGRKIDGVVKDMQSLVNSKSRTLTLFTDKHIYRVDPYDLQEAEKDNDIFFVPYDNIVPGMVGKNDYGSSEFITVDGKIFNRTVNWGTLYYGFFIPTPDDEDYHISMFSMVGTYSRTSKPYCYDEVRNRFFLVSSRNDQLQEFKIQDANAKFDVNNIGPLDAIAMCEGDDMNLVTLFKSEVGNKYYVYSINTQVTDNGINLPVGKMDISNFPGINDVRGFISSPICEDCFYATKDKVYAFQLNNEASIPVPRYTTNTDEEITSMMIWRGEYQRMDVTSSADPNKLSRVFAENKMIVITTYNEKTKEGKVIILPHIRTGDGYIDPNPKTHKEYGGFGRIVKIAYNQIGY